MDYEQFVATLRTWRHYNQEAADATLPLKDREAARALLDRTHAEMLAYVEQLQRLARRLYDTGMEWIPMHAFQQYPEVHDVLGQASAMLPKREPTP